jgi:hypothetical protein
VIDEITFVFGKLYEKDGVMSILEMEGLSREFIVLCSFKRYKEVGEEGTAVEPRVTVPAKMRRSRLSQPQCTPLLLPVWRVNEPYYAETVYKTC